MHILLIAVASLFAVGVVHAQEPAGRVAGWHADIDWWLGQVRAQHYTYRTTPLPPSLTRAATELKRLAERYSDERMLFEMQRLAALVGDGHTYILPFAAQRVMGRMLPVRFYLFSDGLHVVHAEPGYERYIGSRLVRAGPVPETALLSRMRSAVSADNEHMWKWIAPPFLGVRGVLEYAMDRTLGDSVELVLRRAPSAEDEPVMLPFLPPPRLRGVPKLVPPRLGRIQPPLWLQHVSRPYWFDTLPGRVLYVQFNQVTNAPELPLARFGARVDSAIHALRPQAVIVDVRHNNGGNSYLYPPLLDVLVRYDSLSRHARRSRRLHVLVGRNTFSAAQNFISQLDRRARPVFVGEASSSRPNFVGEENEIVLPWSGGIGSISNRYHENMPGDRRPFIPVAIPVSLSSREYFAGEDPVLRAAMEQIRREAQAGRTID
jgi:hypothetical protein